MSKKILLLAFAIFFGLLSFIIIAKAGRITPEESEKLRTMGSLSPSRPIEQGTEEQKEIQELIAKSLEKTDNSSANSSGSIFEGVLEKGITGAMVGLFIGLLAGAIGLIQYFLRKRIGNEKQKDDENVDNKHKSNSNNTIIMTTKSFLGKHLGEILVIVGSGIFIYNVLNTRTGYKHRYEDSTLFMISIGVMLIIAGVFLLINKRKVGNG